MSHALADHTADLALTLEAPDLPALFAEAALALSSLVYGETEAGGPAPLSRNVTVEADDIADLLVDWLREIHYALVVEGWIVRQVDGLEISPGDGSGGARLRAELRAEAFDPDRHEVAHDIKAVTYHRRDVAFRDGLWRAFVVLDI